MHEMSIAQSIVDIADDELKKHNCSKLLLIRVCYGALAQVVPDSLQFCFEALTMDTVHKGALLELEEVPVHLRCGHCGKAFIPQKKDLFAPCPDCGGNEGHSVEGGRELYVKHLEAE